MLLWLLACTPAPTDSPPGVIDPIDTGEAPPPDDTGADSAPDETGDTGDSGREPPPDEAPALLLNEAMSKNTCSVGVAGETPDYVELFNSSPETITLDRVALWDGDGTLWVGSADLKVDPGGWIVLWADGSGADPTSLPFTLTSAGDTLTIAVDGQVTDRLALGMLPADTAWARFPDGGTWGITGAGTPGVTNGAGPAEFEDPFVGAFDTDHLYTVEVTLSDANYQALTRSPTTYVEGAFTLDDVTMENVGVRVRGSSTFQSITAKASLKIDFNRFTDGEYCGDLKKINLLNNIWDESFAKQWSAYHVMRQMGVVSARNGFTTVSINGGYRGVYLYSEVYDDEMLEEYFGYGPTDGWMIWEESGLECETNNCDNAIVSAAIDIWNGDPSEEAFAELQEHLDVEEALREIAGELIVQQTDGFCAPHNFRYAYNPVTELIYILPSSLDLTFYSPVASVDLYRCYGSRLLDFCLDVESCANQYDEILLDYADAIEDGIGLQEEFDHVYSMLDPYFDTEISGSAGEARRTLFLQIQQYWAEMPEHIRSEVGG